MSIRGKCYIYIHEYKHDKWPIVFADNIQVGHYIRSEEGHELKVKKITHYSVPSSKNDEWNHPRIEVTLGDDNEK